MRFSQLLKDASQVRSGLVPVRVFNTVEEDPSVIEKLTCEFIHLLEHRLCKTSMKKSCSNLRSVFARSNVGQVRAVSALDLSIQIHHNHSQIMICPNRLSLINTGSFSSALINY